MWTNSKLGSGYTLLRPTVWLIGLVLGLAACGGRTSDPSGRPVKTDTAISVNRAAYYQVHMTFDQFVGHFVITINGFPVEDLPSTGQLVNETVSEHLNTALVRTGNRVAVHITPAIRGAEKEGVRLGPLRLGAEVRGYQEWSKGEGQNVPGAFVTPTEVDRIASAWSERADSVWRQTRRSGPVGAALDSVRAWARAHPMTVSVTFDNAAGPDYSDIFREAPVIAGTAADSARLRAYAMQLRDWMAAKDTTALMGAYGPAIEDRYERISGVSNENYLRQNREALVVEDVILNFDREDIKLQKWAEGRVWQIIRRGAIHDGFFQDSIGYGKGKVYVAELGDSLHVVRQ